MGAGRGGGGRLPAAAFHFSFLLFHLMQTPVLNGIIFLDLLYWNGVLHGYIEHSITYLGTYNIPEVNE